MRISIIVFQLNSTLSISNTLKCTLHISKWKKQNIKWYILLFVLFIRKMILWCLQWGFVFNITFHRDSHAQSVMHNMHFSTVMRAKDWQKKITNPRWCLVLKAYQRWFHEGISTTFNNNWVFTHSLSEQSQYHLKWQTCILILVACTILCLCRFYPREMMKTMYTKRICLSLALSLSLCVCLCWQITDYNLYLARFEFQKLFVPKNERGCAQSPTLCGTGKWW